MSSTARVIVRVDVYDDDTISQVHKEVLASLTVALANGQRYPLALGVGDNTLDTPDGCNGLLVVFLSGTTPTIKLKGAAGDTGVVVASESLPTLPILIPLDEGSDPILNSDVAVDVEVIFF